MAGSNQTIEEAYRAYEAMFANGYEPSTLIDDDFQALMLTLDDYRNILNGKVRRMAPPVDPDAPVMILIRNVNDLQSKVINGRKTDEEAVLSFVHGRKQVTLLAPQCPLRSKAAPEAEVEEPDS